MLWHMIFKLCSILKSIVNIDVRRNKYLFIVCNKKHLRWLGPLNFGIQNSAFPYKYSFFFLAFEFCQFCVVIFFSSRHNSQWPPTLKDFNTRFYPLHFCPILILQKEPVFRFLMLSAKQENYWYHFYNVFGMMRSLTGDWIRDLPHSKPALYH